MIRRIAAVAIALCLGPSWLSAQTTRLTVTAASANVHKFASIGSPVIGKAPRGTVLVVTRELGSWVRIVWPGGEDGAAFMHVSAGTVTRNVPAENGRTAGGAAAPRRAPAPAGTAARGQSPRPPARPAPARPAPADPRQVYVSPTTHTLGLGARMGGSTTGFGASARAWNRSRLGLQLAVSRATLDGVAAPERLTTFQVEPSLLFTMRDHVSDYVWIRPYLGSGVDVRRQSLHSGLPGTQPASETGLGFNAFGGAELTFAGVPRFALSADLGYRWSRMPVAGYDLGGLGLALSGHWYFK